MTNFERWRSFNEGLPSPDNFINWSFRTLISMALQRRVWLGESNPLYPNIYTILVGPAALGKGLAIKPADEILHEHVLDTSMFNLKNPNNTQSDNESLIAIRDSVLAEHQKQAMNNGNAEPPLVIPVAANAVTYEALVGEMCTCKRRIDYRYFNEKLGRETMGIYTHHSLCFCLPEIASLFRKKTEDVVNFLHQTYDCDKYTYQTVTRQKESIPKTCLSILAGTTPEFMQDTFDDNLISQGFSSRTFFIYASKNRKNVIRIPALTPEQKQFKKDISAHVKKLTNLYGEIKVAEEVWQKLEAWWDNVENHKELRGNRSSKLAPYYGRKNIHVQKLAMVCHFSESTSMEMGWEPFQQAIDILHAEEANMHLALILDGANPMAKASRKIENYIRGNGPQTGDELFVQFYDDFATKRHELDEVIADLLLLGKVESHSRECKITGGKKNYYSVPDKIA